MAVQVPKVRAERGVTGDDDEGIGVVEEAEEDGGAGPL